jgi:hypothetical protein
MSEKSLATSFPKDRQLNLLCFLLHLLTYSVRRPRLQLRAYARQLARHVATHLALGALDVVALSWCRDKVVTALALPAAKKFEIPVAGWGILVYRQGNLFFDVNGSNVSFTGTARLVQV